MARFELITNAVTGEITQRPYTPEEEAAADAMAAAELAAQQALVTPSAEALLATISDAVDKLRAMGVAI